MPHFAALADDTRRHIVEALAEDDRSVTELVDRFSLSQPAISRHLRLLREAGMVTFEPHGKRRMYRLNPSAMRDISRWADRYCRKWESRFDALGEHLDQVAAQRRRGAR